MPKFQQQYLTYITHKEDKKIVFTYKGKKLNINDDLLIQYRKKISAFSVRTIEYLLKTNNGNDGMDASEIENTVNAGMIYELEFNKEATSIIRTLKANKNLQ